MLARDEFILIIIGSDMISYFYLFLKNVENKAEK